MPQAAPPDSSPSRSEIASRSEPAADPGLAGPWWRWGWLGPPVLVGVFLRLFRLPSQLLLGDELHAVRAAQEMDLGEILTTYLPSDNSMPLTAFYELLMGAGVELTELHLRLPVLLAGMVALVVIPVAAARRLGRGVGLWTAWLVAVSPGMVLYSRIARSYLPMVLLAFLAVLAFERWWRTRRPASAVAYVGFGAAAVWFHLGAAPFVAAPLPWAAVAALRPGVAGYRAGPGERLRELARVAALGLGLLAGWATFLVPARDSFAALMTGKAGYEPPSAADLVEILSLQAGASALWATVLFWGLALFGFAVLARRRPSLASYTLLLVVTIPLAVWVMQPLGWASPHIFNRYLLVGLPLLLLWAGTGLARLAEAAREGGRGARLAAPALPGLLLVLLVLGGPWTDPRVLYSSFLHGDDFVRFSRPEPGWGPGVGESEFYRWLAEEPGEEPVLVFNAMPTWMVQGPVRIHQDVHRQPVLLAPLEKPLFEAGGFAPRNYVEPGPESFLASRARWLVVHRRGAWELDRVEREGHASLVPEPLRPIAHRAARRLGGFLEQRWGPPDHQDPWVQAWDLDRVRREGRADPSSTPAPPAEAPAAVGARRNSRDWISTGPGALAPSPPSPRRRRGSTPSSGG